LKIEIFESYRSFRPVLAIEIIAKKNPLNIPVKSIQPTINFPSKSPQKAIEPSIYFNPHLPNIPIQNLSSKLINKVKI
jgi:hypothetical protein